MANKERISHSEDVSILSSGVKIEGNVYSEGNVRIDGKIIGDVSVNGNLTLGETSQLNGDVRAKNVTVSGTVEGTINSQEKLVLESKSKMTGDIVAKTLVIEAGARFDGRSMMADHDQQKRNMRAATDKEGGVTISQRQ